MGGNHDTSAYWEHLGRFVQMFSEAEGYVHTVLRELIDINERVGAAILHPKMSLSEAIEALNALYKVRVPHTKATEAMTRVLSQLKDISVTRNALLHIGTTFTADGAAAVPKRPKGRTSMRPPAPHPLSIEIFDAMTTDCNAIAGFLFIQWQRYSEHEPQQAADAAIERRKEWTYVLPRRDQ